MSKFLDAELFQRAVLLCFQLEKSRMKKGTRLLVFYLAPIIIFLIGMLIRTYFRIPMPFAELVLMLSWLSSLVFVAQVWRNKSISRSNRILWCLGCVFFYGAVGLVYLVLEGKNEGLHKQPKGS